MPIPVSCPCGNRLQAPDALAGKEARCPGCGAVLRIPEPGALALLPIDDPPPPPPMAPVRAPLPGESAEVAPSRRSDANRCEHCSGLVTLSASSFNDGVMRPFDALGRFGMILLIWFLSPCLSISLLLLYATIALIVRGATTDWRCGSCGLRPTALDPVRAQVRSRSLMSDFGKAAACAGGLVAMLGVIVAILYSMAPSAPADDGWREAAAEEEGFGRPDGRPRQAARNDRPADPPAPREPSPSERLRDPDPEIRLAAVAEVVGKEPPDRGASRLLRSRAKDDDPRVRLAVLEGLETVDPDAALILWQQALAGETDETIRERATAALDRRGPSAWIPLLDDEPTGEAAMAALSRRPAEAIGPMTELLDSRDRDLRRRAVEFVLEHGDEASRARVVEILGQELSSSSGDTEWAIERLLSLGGAEARQAIEPLAASLASSSAERRRWAARTLGRFEEPPPVEALARLVAALRYDDAELDDLVAVVLERIGEPAVLALQEAMVTDPSNADDYGPVLDRLDPDARQAALVEAVKNGDPRLRLQALRQLARADREAVDADALVGPLSDCLQGADESCRQAAIDAIEHLGPRAIGTRRAVIELLGEPRMEHDAVGALSAMGAPVVPDLIRAYRKVDERGRRSIRRVFQALAPRPAWRPIS